MKTYVQKNDLQLDVERFESEFNALNQTEAAQVAFRAAMRLLPYGIANFSFRDGFAILRQLLTASLVIAGKIDESILTTAAEMRVLPPTWGTTKEAIQSKYQTIQVVKALIKSDRSAAVGAASYYLFRTGMGGMGEGSVMQSDIHQIRAAHTGPWLGMTGRALPTALPKMFSREPANLRPEDRQLVHPFWSVWYQRIIAGTPQNWNALRDVALIGNATWEQGGAALDEAIDEVLQAHALAATGNGEAIEINPATGRLRLVPASALPDDMGVYIRRKILGAVRLFQEPLPQSYSALAPDLDLLRRAVADAGSAPVELYDACSSALFRLALRSEQGECPPVDVDALLADYRNRLLEAEADILGSDAEAQRVLERRNAIAGNDSLIAARTAITEVVAQAAPLLEGRLSDNLTKDADMASDPNARPQDRATASFRLASRLLRISKQVSKGFVVGNRVMIATVDYVQALEFLATSPAMQQVIQAILRYVGL